MTVRSTRDGPKLYVMIPEDRSGASELCVRSDTIELTGQHLWAEGADSAAVTNATIAATSLGWWPACSRSTGKDEVRLVIHDADGLDTEFDLAHAAVTEDLARSIRAVLRQAGNVRLTGTRNSNRAA